MWRDISAQNRENIITAVDRMIDELTLLRKMMEEEPARSEEVGGYLEAAKAARDGLL
jgi:prephenate dehydrogenase